jgi:hypothetical protein
MGLTATARMRTVARPAVSTERLSVLPDGRLLYEFRHRWRNGTKHVVFEPLEFLAKLAALVPPPRFNLVRYHGILAPAAGWRSAIVPFSVEDEDRVRHNGCREAKHHPQGEKSHSRPCHSRNYTWAELMKPVRNVLGAEDA